MKPSNKGITIVELLAILVILAIIALVAVPSVNRLIENTRVRADLADVTMLNQATRLYQLNQLDYPKTDIFEGISTNQGRQQALVDQGYLSRIISPRISGERFEWNIQDQVWVYTRFVQAQTITLPLTLASAPLADYRRSTGSSGTANFTEDEDGWIGRVGLIYFDNPRPSYTLTLVARLHEDPVDGRQQGGYGILIEAQLVEDGSGFQDRGLILQFDRGYGRGAILIRERDPSLSNGEGSAIHIVNHQHPSLPDKNTPEGELWWASEHTLRLEVTAAGSGQPANEKLLSFYINDQLIIDSWAFTSTVATSQNFTGLRSWGIPTTFKSLLIEP